MKAAATTLLDVVHTIINQVRKERKEEAKVVRYRSQQLDVVVDNDSMELPLPSLLLLPPSPLSFLS